MNVPENLVRNPERQSAIREFKARVREETPESPSRWLPTPPVTLSSVKKAGAESRVLGLRLFDGYDYKS